MKKTRMGKPRSREKQRARARREQERAPLALPPGAAGHSSGEAAGGMPTGAGAPRIDGKWILETLGVPMLQMGGAVVLANAIIKAVTSGREVTITVGPPRAVGAPAGPRGVELRTSADAGGGHADAEGGGGTDEGDDHDEASVDEEKIKGSSDGR